MSVTDHARCTNCCWNGGAALRVSNQIVCWVLVLTQTQLAGDSATFTTSISTLSLVMLSHSAEVRSF